MADKTKLLEAIRKRASRTGIVTADRYFREVEGCFDGGHCPIASSGGTEDQWRKSLKEAETKLTYSNQEMVIVKKSLKKSAGEGLLQFDAIVTTPRRDRDGDVLETKGAKLDKNAPLLWQHMAMQPIGKLVRTVKLTDAELVVRLAIANTALGRDAVELVKMGALRISHGFEPIEYKEMEDEEGWYFTKFAIFEISLVSIPSNTEAVILGVDGKSFDTELVRGWQKSHSSKIVIPDHACTCQKDKALTEAESLYFQKGRVLEVKAGDAVSADHMNQLVRLANDTAQATSEIAKAIAEANAPLELTKDEPLIIKALTPEPDDESIACPKCKSTNTEHVASENGNMHCKACDAYFTHNDDASEDMDDEKSVRSFDAIEREYLAALATSGTDTLRKSHRRLSLILSSAEEFEEAREWDELLSQVT